MPGPAAGRRGPPVQMPCTDSARDRVRSAGPSRNSNAATGKSGPKAPHRTDEREVAACERWPSRAVAGGGSRLRWAYAAPGRSSL